jgi:hypothetical protein
VIRRLITERGMAALGVIIGRVVVDFQSRFG